MFSFVAASVARLDAVYRDRSYFIGLKARLLITFNALVLVFVPMNVAKLLWFQPPSLPLRLGFNLAFALAAALSLWLVRKGRLEFAGSALVLVAVVPVHLVAFLLPAYPQPLSAAILLFFFDLVMLLVAMVFAWRPVAFALLAIIVATNIAFHYHSVHTEPIAGSLAYTADSLLRDGLITMGFIFSLGLTLLAMMEAANLRSEEALEETRATNKNLGRLVAERTAGLEAATRQANEASRAKGDFLANMSHEIRTPLHGIIASADLLQHRADLPPAAAENVRLIAESGELLLNLLTDILDLSKIEADQLTLESRPFELASLALDSAALVQPKAAQGAVRVECSIADGLPIFVEGDSFRLRQILLNLLSNAIKFTPAGGQVELAIRPESDPATLPATVRFEVRDTGIGMDAATVQGLFQRFTQADSSTTRRYGGTGLGLSISAHLIELMGGRIAVESAPDEGSIFHFTLALRPVETDSPLPAPANPPEAPLSLRVLVAEDNAVNRKVLTSQLAKLGCPCTMAGNGEEALTALAQGLQPDVVLMDCHMPELDGWETTRRLRAWATDPEATAFQKRAATIPVIALTAAALPEERTRCLEAGMTNFLPKPAKLSDLRDILTPLARNAKPTSTLATAQNRSAQPV